MAGNNKSDVDQEQFKDLKARCNKLIEADPAQYSDFFLRRFLCASGNADEAYTAIKLNHEWRQNFMVETLTEEDPIIKSHLKKNKAVLCEHRDMHGRPVVYIPCKNHNVNYSDIDELTKFIVYILEEACKKCDEGSIDNFCIVFDLKEFGLSCMDYDFVQRLIWLLSRHYPGRLGVCIIINAPSLFSGCWAIIRGWLNGVNACCKVMFVSNEIELRDYYLDPEILPKNV